MNAAQYFKGYRQRMGFSNQSATKTFLSGKDIIPEIDFEYIKALNNRIHDILISLNSIVHESIKRNNLDCFIQDNLDKPFNIIRKSNLLSRLNNQGRRPEEVLFSWLRGFSVSEYFKPVFANIFGTSLSSVKNLGEDDLSNIDTFRRSPKADLAIKLDNSIIRIEVQSGFQGINDIKEHKVREARRALLENSEHTICIHIDIYNGQVAFVQLDNIAENDINFITRQQMEGQSVFQIDQNYFKWRLLNPVPNLSELELEI